MLKLFFKTIVFLFIMFFAITITAPFFISEGLYTLKSKDYATVKNDLSIAFFGSSHALCSYDPRVFETEFGVNSFNFGTGSQSLITTLPVVKEVVSDNDLQLAVVDIFSATIQEPPFNRKTTRGQLITLDYTSLSFGKIYAHNEVYGKGEIFNMFPTIRHHALWKRRWNQEPYLLSDEMDYYKGFYTTYSFKSKRWKASIKGKKKTKIQKPIKELKLSDYQKTMIDDIIAVFRKKNIPLLFVSAPRYKDYLGRKYLTNQLLIKEYLKSKKIDYIDYNDEWDNLELNKFDFRDVSHLNTKGALKISTHLANYIKQNYNFKKQNDQTLEFQNNRYSLIQNNFEGALAEVDIKDKKIKKSTGVSKIVIYKGFEDRLEFLFLGAENKLKEVKVKIDFLVNKNEVKTLPKDIKKRIKKGKFSFSARLGKGVDYEEYTFKTLILNCPFDQIKNVEILIGRKKANKIAFKIDKIDFKDNQ